MFKVESVYGSLDYESNKSLKKYKKQLKKINALAPKFREMSDESLKDYMLTVSADFSLKNKKQVLEIYAITREVTFRLLGKFQYDVQILGALAALDRMMIQMSTGSGKTITLILPAVAFGLTHKGVEILTVNDYLSKRDWEETKPVYDWFGLTNAYTSQDDDDVIKRRAFDSDITYCTNSTLGFSYLNSALASDIGDDIKVISRPLHAAIIDEVDEILMDDARNPLKIITNKTQINNDFTTIDYYGETYYVSDILNTLKNLKNIGYNEDDNNQSFIDDESMSEILELLHLDDKLFNHPKMMHVIYNCVTALFQYHVYTDYVVLPEPDPDSDSRIALIDKATGRISHGRTLSDNLHSFIEMKEGVFVGNSDESSIQITYQTLFNIFPTIAGVTGTLGTSFNEFKEIYQAGIVRIPDRLPNQLKQATHVYVTKEHMYHELILKTKLYMSSYHPVLVGAKSDNEAEIISKLFVENGIENKLLVSTDDNEETIVANAGKPGSVVVTTDIMGRGTDIHVENVEMERGLVVLQVGGRQNSRVERQFAGRAGRQGQPGRYHRMLSLPELPESGVLDSDMAKIVKLARDNKDLVASYEGDITLNGLSDVYNEVVDIIDKAMIGSESSYSQSRIDDFMTYSITDVIQTSLLTDLDEYRLVIKEFKKSGDGYELQKTCAKLLLDEKDRSNKKLVKKAFNQLKNIPLDTLAVALFNYTLSIANDFIPKLRKYSDGAISTVKISQQVKYDVKPEIFMISLIKKFLEDNKDAFRLNLNL